jgi:hypothetical protein
VPSYDLMPRNADHRTYQRIFINNIQPPQFLPMTPREEKAMSMLSNDLVQCVRKIVVFGSIAADDSFILTVKSLDPQQTIVSECRKR